MLHTGQWLLVQSEPADCLYIIRHVSQHRAVVCVAAVHFELKNYDECIKVCLEAVDIGRENRADFKLIAKYVQYFRQL